VTSIALSKLIKFMICCSN